MNRSRLHMLLCKIYFSLDNMLWTSFYVNKYRATALCSMAAWYSITCINRTLNAKEALGSPSSQRGCSWDNAQKAAGVPEPQHQSCQGQSSQTHPIRDQVTQVGSCNLRFWRAASSGANERNQGSQLAPRKTLPSSWTQLSWGFFLRYPSRAYPISPFYTEAVVFWICMSEKWSQSLLETVWWMIKHNSLILWSWASC